MIRGIIPDGRTTAKRKAVRADRQAGVIIRMRMAAGAILPAVTPIAGVHTRPQVDSLIHIVATIDQRSQILREVASAKPGLIRIMTGTIALDRTGTTAMIEMMLEVVTTETQLVAGG